MLNVALIGLGWWGKTILALLQKSEKVRVVLIIDVDPAARSVAEENGIKTFADFNEAVSSEEVNAIILCTPHKFHCEQIVAAAKAGKHVFCEKPLTLSFNDATRACAAVRNAGVQLGIGHERRFEPPIQEMMRMLKAGELGIPLQAEGNFSHNKAASLPLDSWRFSPIESPGGPLTGTGVHLVDLSVAIFGSTKRVHATLSTMASKYANGDTLAIHLNFADGGNSLITALYTTPFYGRFALFCSKGWVEIIDRSHPEAPTGWSMIRCIEGAQGPLIERIEYPSVSGVLVNLEAFADAALGHKPYPITLDSMLHNIGALDGVLRSIDSREAVDL